jgi:hypothetical protein
MRQKIAFDTALMTAHIVIIHEIKNIWPKTDKFPNRILPDFKIMLAYSELGDCRKFVWIKVKKFCFCTSVRNVKRTEFTAPIFFTLDRLDSGERNVCTR